MKIRSKLILIFFIFLTTIVMLAFFTAQNRISAFIIGRTETMIEQNGQLVKSKIEYMLSQYKKNATWIASSKYIKNLLTLKNKKKKKILNRKIDFKMVRWYGIADTSGRIFISSDKYNLNKIYHAPFPLNTDMQEVRLAPVHWLKYYKNWSIPILTPVYGENGSKGILLLEFKLNNLENLLTTYQSLGQTHHLYLIDGNGRQIQNLLHLKAKKTDLGMEADSLKMYPNYFEQRKTIGKIFPIKEIGVYLVDEISSAEVLTPLISLSKTLFTTFILILFGAILVLVLMSKHLITPLTQLQESVKKVAHGDYNVLIEVSGNDEIAELSRNFKQMLTQIKQNEERLKIHGRELEQVVAERTAELNDKIADLEQKKEDSQRLAKELESLNKHLKAEIEKRKSYEKALTENKERYRIISSLTSDFAFAYRVEEDGSLQRLWIIGAFERITGYRIEELQEKGGWNSIVYPEDTGVIMNQFGRIITGHEQIVEYRIITKNGRIRWMREYARPEWDEAQKRVVMIYGAVQDVTERKKTEEELKQSEISYRELFENTTDAIYLQRRDGRFIAVNKGAEKMYGYPREYFIDKTPEFVAAPGKNDIAKVAQMVEQAFEGEPQTFEFWGQRKNGEIFPKEVRIFKGNFFGEEVVVAMAQDITERKKAEEQLRILSLTVDQSPIAVIIMDNEEQIVYGNRTFSRLTGFKLNEVLGKTSGFLIDQQTSAEQFEQMWNDLHRGETWQGEVLAAKKGGQAYWANLTGGPLLDEEGVITHYICFIIDLTERKRLEEQFRQSQKMEAVGRLAGGIAHDFNNLLTVIIGYSELLLAKLPEEDIIYPKIKQIDHAGRRAEALTRQLLAFSRKQIMQPRILNLNELIVNLEKMLHRLIGEDIQLMLNLNHPLDLIKADPGQIEQVILNISINARDAMPDGGVLKIESKNIYLDEKFCASHDDAVPGHYVMLSISDNGIGMDEKIQSRIFEPFFTTKEQGRGTGLGLSMVYGIIKQSQGGIWVKSKPGHGTTFEIYFPRVRREEGETIELSEEATALHGKETILVVEDEDVLRELAVESLKHFGYQVLTASNGKEALKLCSQIEPHPDLVLTDVVMPKMSGKKLVDKLVELYGPLRVLYMSGYTEDSIVHHGILNPHTDFIQKPFDPLHLAKKVREVLDKQKA